MKIEITFGRKQEAQNVGGKVFRSTRVEPWHASALREEKEFNLRAARMYEASVTSNLNFDFLATLGSANAEIQNSLTVARGRARTLAKDDATMKGILRTYRNNVCGEDPFKLEMCVRKKVNDPKVIELDDEVNTRIETAWKKAGKKKNCTVRKDMSRMEMYLAVITSVKRDGSIIGRHHREFPFNDSHYAIELLESDRLQESYQGRSKDGNPIRFSIERHPKYLFPLYYWILTRHPGEIFDYNGNNPNNWRERVPAADIIHFNNLRDRAEQDVGFPEFDSIIQHLHLNRQFDRAHVSAAVWAQAKPFFMVQETPTGMNYAGDPMQFNQSVDAAALSVSDAEGLQTGGVRGDGKGGGANKYKAVEPATGEILPYGMKPMLVDPKFPNEAAVSFKKSNGELTSVGSGLSSASVTGDYTGMSFSVARAAQVPERLNFRVDQNLMVLNFVEQHFCAWLESEILYGTLIDLPYSRYEEFCDAAAFHAQRWEYIQPVQDAEADIMQIEAKLKSRGQVLAEMPDGGKFEDVIAQQAAEEKIAEAHGIDLHQDVTLATIKKGDPGQTTPEDADGPPKKNETGKDL